MVNNMMAVVAIPIIIGRGNSNKPSNARSTSAARANSNIDCVIEAAAMVRAFCVNRLLTTVVVMHGDINCSRDAGTITDLAHSTDTRMTDRSTSTGTVTDMVLASHLG